MVVMPCALRWPPGSVKVVSVDALPDEAADGGPDDTASTAGRTRTAAEICFRKDSARCSAAGSRTRS